MRPYLISVNRKLLKGDARSRVTEDTGSHVIAWAVAQAKGAFQKAYRLTLSSQGSLLFDSGCVETSVQEAEINNTALPCGARIDVCLYVTDDLDQTGEPTREHFYIGNTDWKAGWITHKPEVEFQTLYFRRDFTISKPVKRARLYGCGIGYHVFYLNGERVGREYLDPAFTDYRKTVQYVFWPEVEKLLRPGGNTIAVKVSGGWRDNYGYTIDGDRRPFSGIRQLSAFLVLEYADGETEFLATDRTWQAGTGASRASRLFDGEIYNAGLAATGWLQPGFKGFGNAEAAPAPGGRMRVMVLPPVREMGVIKPISVSEPEAGKLIYDFGINLSGVVRIRLKGLRRGQRIRLVHAEELDENGLLFTQCLRKAKCTDEYIASGDERDLNIWQPEFTYHGFRYLSVEGYEPEYGDVEAVMLHTDLATDSFFRCGSGEINALQEQVVLTERDNMHSILTDCPQRDERAGWMNDATVRFEETPYNFDCAVMFRKIVRDIADAQHADGSITCTAPYVYGGRPADPVCSSFLVAGMESYRHYADLETIREAYPAYEKWEENLLSNSDDFIVNYSYYGDWAGPVYACEGRENPKSAVTPGQFMSTGYSYFNACRLSEMAGLLGMEAEAAKHRETAEKIKNAMLKKWYHADTAEMATGSMACQAFSLWLGILPEADEARAARIMRDKLVNANYAFTTGNLCSRYLLDMLSAYGYDNEAYELLTRNEYPSFGFMRQHEATTVWERFELKKEPGMNSHNHPMYAAAGSYLYAYLAGVKSTDGGFRKFVVEPHMPDKLMSCQAGVSTRYGRINVRWTKRYGQAHLYVDVPFGTMCEAHFMGENRSWTHGTHKISVPLKNG